MTLTTVQPHSEVPGKLQRGQQLLRVQKFHHPGSWKGQGEEGVAEVWELVLVANSKVVYHS